MLCTFLAIQTTIIANDPSAKVDKSLLEKYISTASNEYLLLMKDRVVFSTTPDFLSKMKKANMCTTHFSKMPIKPKGRSLNF